MENVSQMENIRMMPPPDILSDISRSKQQMSPMSHVMAQLAEVLADKSIQEMPGKRKYSTSEYSPAQMDVIKVSDGCKTKQMNNDDEKDHETLTDVQSCLDYIDGLLSSPAMIDIPQRGGGHLEVSQTKSESSKSMEKLDSIRKMLESGGSKVECVKDRRKMIVKTGELSQLAAARSRQLSGMISMKYYSRNIFNQIQNKGGQNINSSAPKDPVSLDSVLNEDIIAKLPLKQQRETLLC